MTFDELHVFRADSITIFINNMNATVPLLSIRLLDLCYIVDG